MEPSGSPENPLAQDPLDQPPQRQSLRPVSDYRQSPQVKLKVVRHHSVQKPRTNNFGDVRLVRQKSDPKIFNQQDSEFKGNNSISTDVSSKGPSREAPMNQIDSDKIPRNKTPPEASLFHLPVIKKETSKNEAAANYLRNRSRKSDSLQSSFLDGQEIGGEPPRSAALLNKEALPLYNPVEYTKRVQSQGATPGTEKQVRYASPFGREIKPMDELLKASQKGFSAKSIAQFQALLGRPFQINHTQKRLIQGKENSFLVRQREVRESKTNIKNRIKSSCENRETSSKDTPAVTEDTNRTNEEQQKIETDFDDTNLVKENKELYEFSFSKNFYKDKPSSAAVPNVSTFGRDSKDNIERNQFKMPTNMSNRSDKEYLRAKNTTFVNSNVKKKFSLARMKQVQN